MAERSAESPDRDPIELAALADGTLPADRARALRTEVEASAELAARLAEQERALEIVWGAAKRESAPVELRARVEEAQEQLRGARPPAEPGPRVGRAAGMAVVAAAIAMVVVFLMPSEVGWGTLIPEAAELHVLDAEQGPPPARSRTLLDLEVEGVAFPSYAAKFAWTATGVRDDSLHGRRAVTVFYEKGGARVGYTVLSGPAVDPPQSPRGARVNGTRLRSLDVDGRTVVTWVRRGRTCVISGVGVPVAELNELAAWKGRGTIRF
jgi:hypothetical protein